MNKNIYKRDRPRPHYPDGNDPNFDANAAELAAQLLDELQQRGVTGLERIPEMPKPGARQIYIGDVRVLQQHRIQFDDEWMQAAIYADPPTA